MGRIVIATKFNKSGKRVLKTPVEGKRVCAPADRRYRESYKAIEAEFKRNMHKPWQAYIKQMSQLLASYLCSSSVSGEDRYRVIRFLAEGGLRDTALDRPQLADIPEISKMAQEAWQDYMEAFRKLLKEREEALETASYQHDVEKRQLWKEVQESISNQSRPEYDKQTL